MHSSAAVGLLQLWSNKATNPSLICTTMYVVVGWVHFVYLTILEYLIVLLEYSNYCDSDSTEIITITIILWQ